MPVLISLHGRAGAQVEGEASAEIARVAARPPNHGQGDSRKRIVPVVKPPSRPSAEAWEGGAYITLAAWLATPASRAALLLQPTDDVALLAGRFEGLELVAVDFHRINDGRGYSLAEILRRRLGYQGRLRALGAVTADQVHALSQVGFDEFELRPDQTAEPSVAALSTFSFSYQKGAAVATNDARARAVFEAKILLLERQLRAITARHGRVALASSLSGEDMVVLDAITRLNLPIDTFTLDTGRLHAETLALIAEAQTRYGREIRTFRPVEEDISAYVSAHGRDGFYDGLTQRKLCCALRKVAPLNQALAGVEAWITGMRREQILIRNELAEKEQDTDRGLAKYNPLADWTWADVLAYADRFVIPMNPLYQRGYVSIGCEPCTKAVRPGDDPRSGRWWWENQDSKECGLHT